MAVLARLGTMAAVVWLTWNSGNSGNAGNSGNSGVTGANGWLVWLYYSGNPGNTCNPGNSGNAGGTFPALLFPNGAGDLSSPVISAEKHMGSLCVLVPPRRRLPDVESSVPAYGFQATANTERPRK